MIRLNPSPEAAVWGAPSLKPWFDDPGEKTGEVWFTHRGAAPPLASDQPTVPLESRSR
jgi:hypothetical protein